MMTPDERYLVANHAFRQALAFDRDGVADDLARLNGDERRALRERTQVLLDVLDDMDGAE